jgi:hypothetical protein
MSGRAMAERQTWAVDAQEVTAIGVELITGADVCPACQMAMPWVKGKLHASRCAGLRQMAKAVGRERRGQLRGVHRHS